jgi:hypothetical protein
MNKPFSAYGALAERQFWADLVPELAIERQLSVTERSQRDVSIKVTEAQREQFTLDGYFVLPKLFEKDDMKRLRKAIARIVALGLPPVFVFLFDEPWLAFARARRALEVIFVPDYLILSNFWAWDVANAPEDAGFAPHRDFYDRCILDDGMPGAVSLWVALSDAKPPGSCLYFLPASRDPNYPGNLRSIEIPDLQSIRAAPVRTGGMVGVGANVLHWGARGSSLARSSRVSIAVEIVSARIQLHQAVVRKPDDIPGFDERLRLVGAQILMFQHHHRLEAPLLEFARSLSL